MMREIRLVEHPNHVLLFSGGLDSTYALLKLAKDVDVGQSNEEIQVIFIDYGHFAAPAEWKRVRQLAVCIRSKLTNPAILRTPIRISLRSDLFRWCRNVAFTGKEVGDETPEIQNRNMVLFSVLFSYLMACAKNQGVHGADFDIHTGFKGNEMSDCSRKFLDGLTDLFNGYQKEYKIKISALRYASRHQTTERIKKLLKGSQYELERLLKLTTSCYATADGTPCGKCWKCRQIAVGKG